MFVPFHQKVGLENWCSSKYVNNNLPVMYIAKVSRYSYIIQINLHIMIYVVKPNQPVRVCITILGSLFVNMYFGCKSISFVWICATNKLNWINAVKHWHLLQMQLQEIMFLTRDQDSASVFILTLLQKSWSTLTPKRQHSRRIMPVPKISRNSWKFGGTTGLLGQRQFSHEINSFGL